MGQHSLADIRAKFVAREKSVTLVMDGGLLAEHEQLTSSLEKALQKARNSLADDGGVRALGEQIQAVEARLADATVTFKVRGIGRNQFRRLLADNPGKDGSGWDKEEFPVELIAACSLDPVMTREEVIGLGDILSDGQWEELFDAAFAACREVDGIPFNVAASVVTQP